VVGELEEMTIRFGPAKLSQHDEDREVIYKPDKTISNNIFCEVIFKPRSYSKEDLISDEALSNILSEYSNYAKIKTRGPRGSSHSFTKTDLKPNNIWHSEANKLKKEFLEELE